MSESPRNKLSRAVSGSEADAEAPADVQSVDTTDAGARTDLRRPKEVGGPAGPEPTRYGDWERKGRCIDF